MKTSKQLAIIIAIILIALLSSTKVFAGYVSTEKNKNTVKYETVIHLTNSKTLENEAGKSYIKVTSMEELKNQFKDNSIILIENDMIENIDSEWMKTVLNEKNTTVLIGYENLKTEVAKRNSEINISKLAQNYNENTEKVSNFSENGYYRVAFENEELRYGEFLVKAKSVEKLLEYVNVNLGRVELTDRTNEVLTIIDEPIEARTATNHLIRFYWADSTVDNKIYREAIPFQEYKRIDLYKGEIVYELGGEYHYGYTSGGDEYNYYFTKVHGLNMYGQYIDGYMIVSAGCIHPDGDGWWGQDYGFNQARPLWEIVNRGLNSGSTEAPNHFAIRTVNGVNYYGIRVRTTTSLYNGSGSYIQSAPVGSWVWTTTKQNMCGASNHHYMSINGYSSSKTGAITTFSATTFVDAGFNTNTPLNYKITTRWWS